MCRYVAITNVYRKRGTLHRVYRRDIAHCDANSKGGSLGTTRHYANRMPVNTQFVPVARNAWSVHGQTDQLFRNTGGVLLP